MKEKKFRIWDIETKHFFYWNITDNPPTCLTKEYIKNNTEEFTGLKDKNKKEIYQNDILFHKSSTTPDGFEGNLWKNYHEVWWNNNDARFLIGNVNGSTQQELSKFAIENWELKIVGNIHENPKLIKEK